ncbi:MULTISPECIES: biotin-independent malonate decarboxylase subunit gamma [Rhodopseudomonas]|uniref:Malonate decarboxylase subunit gamma n=1 Tax=Rhodopseudomonas palustris TaxID=1076 RepID=A0A0D7EJL1_RHOPL|nr:MULTISPECIES: biotin-independent malonate decarboxylase subunit gamma [Rhodopseudomonas]KIZ40826.1 malonate decarboxylase subunit gamma [Rhodopseudomonas palustris]MDF3812455.1 biotin-independent malonate decarboxylase subunit gamma [Rhodopseudomonas sp. BAL398]WOK19454.1 biotin-independent malonate decarboxylase subunit gamma [Rhodopseudomonas sp. BAL398]
MDTLLGKGREAVDLIVDPNSFAQDKVGSLAFTDATFGPGAVVGEAKLDGQLVTVIASDAEAFNEKFPVVYSGIIGMEEGYKMAQAVYASLAADAAKKPEQKRAIILVVDTPGNGPGKVEEIFGMNKATGAYQLALAEARLAGHPIVAMVVGRAISGAFLCHGLQADRILSLDAKFQTMIHVMPITSVSRIIKKDIEVLEELAKSNPVFAAGPTFFYQLGGVEELVSEIPAMREAIIKQVAEIRKAKAEGLNAVGPRGRGKLGQERGGRKVRPEVLARLNAEFAAVQARFRPQAN